MRINARLDDARVKKLKQLKSLTRLGVSEIVKRAIDLLYRQQAGRSRDKLDALLASDFVGCAEGPEDLASRVQAISERGISRTNMVLTDTGYWLALANARDRWHEAAVTASRRSRRSARRHVAGRDRNLLPHAHAAGRAGGVALRRTNVEKRAYP